MDLSQCILSCVAHGSLGKERVVIALKTIKKSIEMYVPLSIYISSTNLGNVY